MVNSTGLPQGIRQAESRSNPPRLMFLVTASTSAIALPESNLTWTRCSWLKRRNLRPRGVPIARLRDEPALSIPSRSSERDHRPQKLAFSFEGYHVVVS